jgi:hypothetical protein
MEAMGAAAAAPTAAAPTAGDVQNAALLLESARAGDAPAVDQILQGGGIDVNVFTADGFSPLIYAAAGGYLHIVEALLVAGADESHDRASHSAIRAASLYGRADVVDLLLAAGADPNHVCAGGQTALMGASMHGHVEAARLLLANGADADAINDAGDTAATIAEAAGHEGVADCRPLLAEYSVARHEVDIEQYQYERKPERPLIDFAELLTRILYMGLGVAFLVIIGLVCCHIDAQYAPPKEEL